MKRAIIFLICTLLLATGLFTAACQREISPTDPPQPDPVLDYANIPYGAHPLQTMDIHIPEGTAEAHYPVVLTVHGGEWTGGDKSADEHYTATILASGCIHVSINYRLLHDGIPEDTETPYEVMLDDIASAFAFLSQNAETYQVDTGKAGIAGYSAGGYLALLYAYTRADPPIPIHFVISEAGSANFLDPKTFSEDGETWLHSSHNDHGEIEVWPLMPKDYRLSLIGAIVGTDYGDPGWEEAWKKASPVYVVTSASPATYLFYGTHDPIVPMSHAELLERNHLDCHLYEILNATHEIHRDPTDLENFHSQLRLILEEFKTGDLQPVSKSRYS